MASNVVNLYFGRVGLFYRFAFCVVVFVMVEHFVEFVFCFMVCVVEICLVFFLHLTLVSFIPWFVLSKFVLLFWFDFENGVFCFAVFDLWFAFFYYCGSLISWGCFAYWFVISLCVEDFAKFYL